MDWRVATRPQKGAFEVIAPEDWNRLTLDEQLSYQSVQVFRSEQEADRFATGLVDAARTVRLKAPRRLRFQKEAVPTAVPIGNAPGAVVD